MESTRVCAYVCVVILSELYRNQYRICVSYIYTYTLDERGWLIFFSVKNYIANRARISILIYRCETANLIRKN